MWDQKTTFTRGLGASTGAKKLENPKPITNKMVARAVEAWARMMNAGDRNHAECMRYVLDAAITEPPPVPVVPFEITRAGLDAYHEEQGAWADRAHQDMGRAYIAMRALEPKAEKIISEEDFDAALNVAVDGGLSPLKAKLVLVRMLKSLNVTVSADSARPGDQRKSDRRRKGTTTHG